MSLIIIQDGTIVSSASLPTHNSDKHVGSAKRDAASGVAGLDASGDVLAATAAPRTIPAMKNVASGIAGLDANGILTPSNNLVGFEDYNNHMGTVDNFMRSATGGSGTAVTDAANHEMDLAIGTTTNAYANYAAATGRILNSRPVVCNFRLDNIVYGTGGDRMFKIGLAANFAGYNVSNFVGVRMEISGAGSHTEIVTSNAANYNKTDIATLVNGDIITIVVTNSYSEIYVNNILVGGYTTYLPTVAVKEGVGVLSFTTSPTTAPSLSVDYMGIRRY